MGERIVLASLRAFIKALVEFGYLTEEEAAGIRPLVERVIKTSRR